MITLTPAAEERIREQGAGEAGEPVHLRVAARLDEHGSIEYGLGFDEPRAGDAQVPGAGVVVLVAAASQELLQDVILDYLEVEPGQFRFVFARGSEP
ncbi:MAG: iron-sulfur cluster assembly accessory protein [Betaproteobacteria bacterium]|nr:iron-sulfur cluster assembly accessory protein [Betaproteobacteria bacterium]